jgi:hypothetical protein
MLFKVHSYGRILAEATLSSTIYLKLAMPKQLMLIWYVILLGKFQN